MAGGIEEKISTINEIRVRCSLNQFWKFMAKNLGIKNLTTRDQQKILDNMYLPSKEEGIRIVKMDDGELQFTLFKKNKMKIDDIVVMLGVKNKQYYLENIAKIPESSYSADISKEDYLEYCLDDKNEVYPILGCISSEFYK